MANASNISLIPAEDITTLLPASQVKQVADAAEFIHESQSIATVINMAANTGAHSVTYSHAISKTMLTTLETQGYVVTQNDHAADPTKCYMISGF